MLLLGLLLLSEICATGSAATRSDHRSGIRHDDLPRLEYAIIPEAVGADFSLAMTVNGTYLALAALGNGTSDLVLRAQLEGTSPGTPAYINTTAVTGTSPYNTSLVLNLTDTAAASAAGVEPGAYGLFVPDVGSLDGVSENVVAVKDYQDFNFQIIEGTVFHELTSASQSWFACEDAAAGSDGVPGYVLRWGVFTVGSAAPPGCSVTSVVQDFNVATGPRMAETM